ncbi:MAG: peptidoglycan-binding protein [Paracoccaceae bacterium]|nr:peptidoglycan-binding protein [Paracoccaceae bacterium]MDP7186691.1 peptidoglycan-binding protein [Paracoccaceae bacterium]
MIRSIATGVFTAALLTGCTLGLVNDTALTEERPDGAAPGTCWAKQIKPAVIQTSQTQSVLTGDGGETIYQTETSQTIVEERQEVWFQVPCRRVMTEDFIKAVQRALQARAIYRGPITGVLDQRTAKAIGIYQRPLGIDSQVLSLLAAKELGLVAGRF